MCNNIGKKKDEPVADIMISQGYRVIFWGIFGSTLALVPALLLVFPNQNIETHWIIVSLIGWACFVGWPVTYMWSKALHERIVKLRKKLKKVDGLLEEEKKSYPGRIPWMPAWIGIYERAIYAILIGTDVAGGAAFIGVWIGIKLAGGWQLWSKGTTYGSAIFFSGLLGNILSAIFGIVAGLVIKILTGK